MVIREFYEITTEGQFLYRSYSDNGYKIRKLGTDEIYYEAIDLESSNYVYEETDEKIEIGVNEGSSYNG